MVALLALACGHTNKGTAMSHGDAQGLWQQSGEVDAPGSEGATRSSATAFNYEGGHVTLRLFVISKVNWKSDDGFYTLRARWQGDVLEYLPPTGEWTPLAEYRAGTFTATGEGKQRVYARIAPDQVAPEDAAIVKPGRPEHDYSKTR